MAIAFTLPLGKKSNIKDLVFSILTKEYPLKLVELTNLIRKRYGRSVTFQAVRKATLELVDEDVLIKQGTEFSINKIWVAESKKFLDTLHEELISEKTTPRSSDSIGEQVSVFTFDSVNELMKFWQDLIDDWFKNFKKGDPNVNCYQAPHAWEGLLHLDSERKLMGQLKKKGIVCYLLSTGNTPLDKNIRQFYRSLGVTVHITGSSSSFDRSFYIGTYGPLIVQAKYPNPIVDALDAFFKKNRTMKNFDLKELSEIVNRRMKIKLTVIKNQEMAAQINTSIISQIE